MSINAQRGDYRSPENSYITPARQYHNDSSSSSRVSDAREWDPDSGTMSRGRRTFCLLTAFDLILTFILWVIYTQLIGVRPVWQAFNQQVGNYTFEKSLFDTVMIATARFTFIMLAYALFRIRHWWVIAITTSMTCIYLLTKCFIFEFNDQLLGGKNPLSYVLLIVCFVLAWVETWMLDFKVIPSETRMIRDSRASGFRPEREPLLGGHRTEYSSTRSMEETTGETHYYSPFHTPEGSEDEGEVPHSKHGSHGHHHHHHGATNKGHSRTASEASMYSVQSASDTDYYLNILEEAKVSFMEVFRMDGWKHEGGKSLEEGMIYSQNIKKFGRKIFKLRGIVEMAPADLWHDMVHTLNDSPKWNPTILESRTLIVIDDNTEVMYNVSAESAGGLISARDFTTIRRWVKTLQEINDNTHITYNIASESAGGLVSARDFINARQWLQMENGIHISYGVGCTHHDMPVQKKYVRGDNGPGGWVFEPVENEPHKCLFTWIVNTNLKGWLPQTAIDQAMSYVLSSYFKLLVGHYEEVLEHRRTHNT